MSGRVRSRPLAARVAAAVALLLLLGVHVAAASLAADCAARCQHSCCRIAAGAAGHCGHAAGQATRCGLRGRCGHALESAITALPPLVLPVLATPPRPLAGELTPRPHAARPSCRAARIDSPPPQPVS